MNKSDIPAAQKSVLGMLIDDHRSVKKLFTDFKTEKDDSKKERLVKEACLELVVHTKIEEQVFYPFLREQDPEIFGDLLDEALVEHATAKNLIAQLGKMQPADDLYDAKFTVLGEYINHHVKEEEGELFPKVISRKIDLQELESPMVKIKKEMMGSSKKQEG